MMGERNPLSLFFEPHRYQTSVQKYVSIRESCKDS